MQLMGAGADAGRHRGSLQAGRDARSHRPQGVLSLASCLSSMKGMGGKLWRRMRKKDLEGGLEARKYDLVGKLGKARTHGHSYGLPSGWVALPVLHVEGPAQRVSLPERHPPMTQHTTPPHLVQDHGCSSIL